MATTDIITKRIHVGGLTSSITTAHIKDRFKSFGNVLEVEEMGVDGLGEHRPFTFFTIQTTPGQLRKCLNIMSGSMWRGCQLRLAEAKPRYDARLEKERNPSTEAVEDRLRKRKRRVLTARGPDSGKEAQDMRIPDESNYKTKKFWSMTEDGRLIRPIAIRPTHALPPINIASSSTDKSGNKRRGLPPKRTRIRVINPSTWHPSHHSESDLPAEETELARDDEWIFESDEEEEEDEEGRILVGRWVQRGGVDDHLQEVWISGKIAQGALPVEAESEDGAVSDVLVEPAARDGSTSPLFASRRISRSPSPLFPNRPADVASQRDHGSSSPLFPGRTADEPSSRGPPSPLFPGRAAAFEDESDTGEMESLAAESPASAPEATPTSNKRSTSPLFASRKPSALPTPSVSAPTLPVTAAKPDAQVASSEETASNPFYEVAKAERSRDLGFLAAFLGEDVTADNKPTKGEWAGFDEDDDDDLEDIAPLRIRGGKADFDDDDSEEDEDMSDSSSSDSSDDSDSESESGGEARNTSAAKLDTNGAVKLQAAAPVVTASAKPQSALKAMFAPAPAQSSFSLLGALDADIELDEELDIPLAPPVIRQPLEPVAELQPLTQSKKSHFDPDPSIPLFFPSFGKGGKDAMREDTEREDYQGFWRQETDEEMKEIWERDKVELTRDWKKRYREGKKQKKRRGGANDVE